MNETIGPRIGELISALGIRKVRFAERIKVDQAYITQLTKGKRNPSDRLIDNICREFNVNEAWLRTGEGPMFVEHTREEEIETFFKDIMQGEPDFRRRLVSVLARMPPDEWDLLERKAQELVDEMKKSPSPAQPTGEELYEKNLDSARNMGSSVSNTTDATTQETKAV